MLCPAFWVGVGCHASRLTETGAAIEYRHAYAIEVVVVNVA